MDVNEILFVGIKGQVLALDRRTGQIVWRRKLLDFSLAGDSFVNVSFDGASLFAHTLGKLFCLDAETGKIMWSNNLDGCGYGIASLAGAGLSKDNPPLSRMRKQAVEKLASVLPIAGIITGTIIGHLWRSLL